MCLALWIPISERPGSCLLIVCFVYLVGKAFKDAFSILCKNHCDIDEHLQEIRAKLGGSGKLLRTGAHNHGRTEIIWMK